MNKKPLLLGFVFPGLALSSQLAQGQTGGIYSVQVLPEPFRPYSNQFCWLDTILLSSDTNVLKIDTTCDSWQLGYNQKIEMGTPGEDFGIETDLDSAYPTESNCSFIIQMPTNPLQYGQTILLFEHRYLTDSLKDGGIIEFSFNGTEWNNVVGSMWSAFYNFPGIDNQTGSYQVDSLPRIDTSGYSFTGTNSNWTWSGLELIWAMMTKNEPLENNGGSTTQEDQILFRFRFKSDTLADSKPGWMIRNLVVGYADIGGMAHASINAKPPIFPNPTNDRIKIQSELPLMKVTLVSLQGLSVSMEPDSENTISLKNFIPGLYWLQVQTSKGLFHSKILKE